MKKQQVLINDAPGWQLCATMGECGVMALVCLALALAGCGKPPEQGPEKMLVRTTVVQPLANVRTDGEASYLAQVRAEKETDLSFKLAGIVEKIGPAAGTDWDEATPVKAGQVLAQLKQEDFINIRNAARGHADLTGKTLDRDRQLLAKRVISPQEFDTAEGDWTTAKALLDEAEQNVRDSQLVATRDGVVLARYVNSRVTVNAGQPVLRVADTSLMSIELQLPDRLISRFTPGKEVPVEVSALEGMPPFRGRVSEVGVAANAQGRLYRVVIKVPNPDGLLRSGMTARIPVDGIPEAAPGTVCVPLSALVTVASSNPSETGSQQQLAVFVAQDGKAVCRKVKTGDILSSSILVSGGLKAGERVVTSGASLLYDGAPIEADSDGEGAR
jgi:multidrug efflux system membrane fusion protein